MTITDIRIQATQNKAGRLLAFASVTIDNELVLHDMKIIQGDGRVFLAMPSYKMQDGFRDIYHPINSEARNRLEQAVIEVYMSMEDSELEGYKL